MCSTRVSLCTIYKCIYVSINVYTSTQPSSIHMNMSIGFNFDSLCSFSVYIWNQSKLDGWQVHKCFTHFTEIASSHFTRIEFENFFFVHCNVTEKLIRLNSAFRLVYYFYRFRWNEFVYVLKRNKNIVLFLIEVLFIISNNFAQKICCFYFVFIVSLITKKLVINISLIQWQNSKKKKSLLIAEQHFALLMKICIYICFFCIET